MTEYATAEEYVRALHIREAERFYAQVVAARMMIGPEAPQEDLLDATEHVIRVLVGLRARCASLEAVVEAAKGIALRQSPAHQALRQALVALDQHASSSPA